MPEKSRLDWFKLDCQDDDKMELIEAEFGLTGYAVIIKLWKKIYGTEGYYCDWNSDISLLMAKKLGLQVGFLNEIVAAAIRRGIFDLGMYERHSILTSHGIQKRFTEAVGRRKCEKIKNEYLLEKCAQKSEDADISGSNVDISGSNVDISKQIREDKRREDKIRKDNKKSPASGLSGIIAAYTQNNDLRTALGEFVKMRKTLRKPLTENALNLQLKELNKLGDNDSVKLAVVNQSVMNSWQGFYPLKKEAAQKAQRQEEDKNASYNLDDWNRMIRAQQSGDFDYSQMLKRKGGG